jgi:hypothetical protein
MWLGAAADSISSINEFVLPVWATPKSAGRIVFQTAVSYNDGRFPTTMAGRCRLKLCCENRERFVE